MKKVLFLSAALLLFNAVASSQTVLFEDNFDSYTAGGYLAVQSDDWTTWSRTAGDSDDGRVTTEQALSAPNSIIVQGQTDLVLLLGDRTEKEFEIKFNIFVEAGYGGYYNFLHKFDGQNSEWAFEVYFSRDGTGYINAGGSNAANFTYIQNVWVECVNIVDLDADSAQLIIDGNLVHTWQWSLTSSGRPGLKQLGALDI